MIRCSVCEVLHGDGSCPDCDTLEAWRAKTAQEQAWRAGSKARKQAA